MEKTFENWLVVSDIDGTLNNKIRKLPKRNYDAIKKFTELAAISHWHQAGFNQALKEIITE